MGESGRAMVAENRGALEATVQLVQSALQRHAQEVSAAAPERLPGSERA